MSAYGGARVGISGWTYAPWRGVFYPPQMPHRLELPFAASRLSSIEINGSFYSLQTPSSYAAWRAATPEDFVFSVKGPRFITHMKKLAGVEEPLANFFASGVLALQEKLGPVLWQLPPTLGYDAGRLAAFFDLLPRTTVQAAALAERHGERLTDRALTVADADRPLRHALEVRHASFTTPELPRLLRDHDIGLVVADTAGKWPYLLEVTSGFVYCRLHGSEELYVSGYDAPALDAWAERISAWRAAGLDTYAYFDNDVKVRAPFDALGLAQRLGIAWEHEPPAWTPRPRRASAE
ncbi:uncharacterized protein YecE (DUF72 family) [Motilibacter rhizosphaerae]|uniref:Uncharacterized protein YecE (DUF72 family) n=1 Tax=Motilibacter rhizosphaerae TaxID=598652 RepID=A0A4V2F4P6_9ACTN|nr:DUF72 domain-containing protein [Motilibacter rhizosphaerae]RZS90049.1 uncharacterized protein YecE (DUF72 family) [Motilibacter rhizosphaerae]